VAGLLLGLEEGAALEGAAVTDATEELCGGVPARPPHAAATNVTTTSKPATPIRIRKSCLTSVAPHLGFHRSVDSS
jgi:hypothetical protein